MFKHLRFRKIWTLWYTEAYNVLESKTVLKYLFFLRQHYNIGLSYPFYRLENRLGEIICPQSN